MLIAFFGGAMADLPETLQRLEVQGQSLAFHLLEGVVVGEKSWSRTSTSQAVNGATRLRSTLTQEIWVRGADGQEYPFKLIDQRISVRDGNEITVLLGSSKTIASGLPHIFWNRTTRQRFVPAGAVSHLVASTRVSGGCLALIGGAVLSWVSGSAVFLLTNRKTPALTIGGLALVLALLKVVSKRRTRAAIVVAVEKRLAEIQQVV